jgi:hypothetical protein
MPAPSAVVEGFSVKHAQICDGTSTFLQQLAAAVAVGLDIYGVNNASLAADVGNYENQGDDQTQSRWNWLNFATVAVQGGYLSLPLYSTLSGQPLQTLTPVNAVQTISSNGASAGTFTLTFGGQTTAPIAYTATAAAVQTALQALSSVGNGNLLVTGGPANSAALTVTAAGTLAGAKIPLLAPDLSGLTGAAGGVVAETTPGSSVGYGIDLWHEDSMNIDAKPLILVVPSKDSNRIVRRLVIGLYSVQFGPIGFDGPSFKDGLKVNYEGTALMSGVDETGVPFADGKQRIGRLLSVA